MTNGERFNLITRNLEEVLTEDELNRLLESGTPLRHYIGFEISGKLHIGHFFQLLKVKDLQDAGAETIIWLADLHSAINDKLDGNLETIKRVALEYFAPAMEALFECIGGEPKKLDFRLCSEEYAKNPNFWMTFLEMGKGTSLARSKRSMTIMGREATDDGIETAKIMYPIMQAADIFLLQANIAHAGIDQRKVHVVAREASHQIKTFGLKDKGGNPIKPVAIHTPILLGLNYVPSALDNDKGVKEEIDELAMRTKMSKSKAGSAVSVHDTPEEIKEKLNKAFAPEGFGDYLNNAVLNWTKYLIFASENASLTIRRPEKWGGDKKYDTYEELEDDYGDKKLHPQDLKAAVAEWIITTLEPVRKGFEDRRLAMALKEVEELSNRK